MFWLNMQANQKHGPCFLVYFGEPRRDDNNNYMRCNKAVTGVLQKHPGSGNGGRRAPLWQEGKGARAGVGGDLRRKEPNSVHGEDTLIKRRWSGELATKGRPGDRTRGGRVDKDGREPVTGPGRRRGHSRRRRFPRRRCRTVSLPVPGSLPAQHNLRTCIHPHSIQNTRNCHAKYSVLP